MKRYEKMGLSARDVMELVTIDISCTTCPCADGRERCAEEYEAFPSCVTRRFVYLDSEVDLKPRFLTLKTAEDLDKAFEEWNTGCRKEVECNHASCAECLKDWLKEEVEV